MILPFFRVKYQLTQLVLLIFGVVFSLNINYSEKINFYISAYTVYVMCIGLLAPLKIS